jgi:hypothetical protein
MTNFGVKNKWLEPSNHNFTDKISFWLLMTGQQVVTREILEYQYTKSSTQSDHFVVLWLPNDPRNSMQFSVTRMLIITLVAAFATSIVSLTSSACVGGIQTIIDHFKTSD